MKIYRHSKGSIFLLEIIINLIIFSALVIISLQFILKAHTITNDTTMLHNGVTQCSNVASLFEKSDGSVKSLQPFFAYSTYYEDVLQIYYNKDFEQCSKEDSLYLVYVCYSDKSTEEVPQIVITMKYFDREICSITAATHTPYTLTSKEVQ